MFEIVFEVQFSRANWAYDVLTCYPIKDQIWSYVMLCCFSLIKIIIKNQIQNHLDFSFTFLDLKHGLAMQDIIHFCLPTKTMDI